MKQQTIYLSILALILIIGAYYFYPYQKQAEDITSNTSTTTNETTPTANGNVTPSKTLTTGNTDGLYGYANGEYNFTMRFPSYVQTRNDFTTFHTLASNWRLNASQVNQGKPVVSFSIKRIDQGSEATGKSYPLYFTAEVRVGVSPNVKLCYEPDAGYTNQKITNVIINGVTFKRFDFADAAMMQYQQGASYRTIHNNKCYVLEQIKAGSSYRDETMTTGLSEATLTGYYNVGESIIKTFKFTK